VRFAVGGGGKGCSYFGKVEWFAMGDLGSMLILFAVLFGAMYFFMIRPEKKRREEKERFLSALKVGDKVVTVAGIIGEVVSVSGDEITLNIGVRERNRVRIIRGGVLKFYEEAASSDDKDGADKDERSESTKSDKAKTKSKKAKDKREEEKREDLEEPDDVDEDEDSEESEA
jgi:preprotein translocase subunit YajC